MMRRILPIAILAVPFLVRYALAEKPDPCEKTQKDYILCPEPPTTVDCTQVGSGACDNTKGQKRLHGYFGTQRSDIR